MTLLNILLIGFGLACLLIGACAVSGARAARKELFRRAYWRVEIGPAQKWSSDYLGFGELKPVDGQYAVRLVDYDGEKMTLAVLLVADKDFEDMLQTAIANAENRAAALNATEEEMIAC